MRLRPRFPAIAFATVLATAAARADDVADFYRGRALSLVAGFNVGGGADTYARLIARHLGALFVGLLESYAEVARQTDDLVAQLPDLDASHPLPPAPWFEPGARWSARRVVLHVIAEIAQHAGHADIIRESLDGAKSMG